jgi:hypothetical protein
MMETSRSTGATGGLSASADIRKEMPIAPTASGT